MPGFRPPDPRAWRAVLFDMNDTFMFGGDRFGPNDDVAATYRALGGRALSEAQVRAASQACLQAFWRDYADPAMAEAFPLLQEHVAAHAGVPASEQPLLAQALALHEVGKVPDEAAQAVRRVAAVTAVGLVSNVWAPSAHWQDELRRCGLAPLWQVAVFSSDIRAVKPSPKPFLLALERLGLPPSAVLFVGDSLARDIRPARALGMGTCLVGGWVGQEEADHCLAGIGQMP